jgi:hypothetical protein
MQIILSCSVYSLSVYISCIMQHINNILIVCFQKNYENLCPGHKRPSFGLSCGYSVYIAKEVLEYFVRHVVTNSLGISFQRLKTLRTPSQSAVLTTNRGNAIIMWRDCNWYHLLVFIKCSEFFLSLEINNYYWATITSNLVTRVFDWHL